MTKRTRKIRRSRKSREKIKNTNQSIFHDAENLRFFFVFLDSFHSGGMDEIDVLSYGFRVLAKWLKNKIVLVKGEKGLEN